MAGTHRKRDIPEIELDLKRAALLVALCSTTILILAYMRLYVILTYGTETIIRDLTYLDLDAEAAIPAWYSSIVLMSCGALLLMISRLARQTGRPDVLRWTLLALTFCLLSLDEAVAVHEWTMVPLRQALDVGGVLYFAWVIPAVIMVAIFGLYMLPLLLRVPKRTAAFFVIAGGLYVGGALGFEMIEGAIVSANGMDIPLYKLAVAVEEGLEIAGLTVFFAALTDYIGREWPSWAVRAGASSRALAADGENGPGGEITRIFEVSPVTVRRT